MLWKFRIKRRSTKRKLSSAASDALSGDIVNPLTGAGSVSPLELISPVAERRRDGHLGMQGYAPILGVTFNRRYCEYCAEGVYAGDRHVCWGNAEHHIDTLTQEERTRILAQLAAHPKKLTRTQIRKLYASDGKGELQYEADKPKSKKTTTPGRNK